MRRAELIGSPFKWALAVLFVDLMRAIGSLAILIAMFAAIAFGVAER